MIAAKKFPQYELAPRAERPVPKDCADPFKARGFRYQYRKCDPKAGYRALEVAGRLKVNKGLIDDWVRCGYLKPEPKPVGSNQPRIFRGSEVNAFISRIRFSIPHGPPEPYGSQAKHTPEQRREVFRQCGIHMNEVRWGKYRAEKAAREAMNKDADR